MVHKRKFDKLGFVKIQNFGASKDTTMKMKRQATTWVIHGLPTVFVLLQQPGSWAEPPGQRWTLPGELTQVGSFTKTLSDPPGALPPQFPTSFLCVGSPQWPAAELPAACDEHPEVGCLPHPPRDPRNASPATLTLWQKTAKTYCVPCRHDMFTFY